MHEFNLGLSIDAAAHFGIFEEIKAKLGGPQGRRHHGKHVVGQRAKRKARNRRRNKIAAATRRSMRHA